jgi:hypothetical protein
MAGYMHLATTLKAVSVRHSHRRSYSKQAFSLAVWRGASASKPYSALPVASTRRWSSPVAPRTETAPTSNGRPVCTEAKESRALRFSQLTQAA